MSGQLISLLAAYPPEAAARIVSGIGDHAALDANGNFHEWSHMGQTAPDDDWDCWVIKAGRGFGKTRAGAEWISAQARALHDARIALVAATLDEARSIMVEGESGLIAVAGDHIRAWYPALGRLIFTSGAEAALFSGASPGKLRGPQHHFAWCDELAKWKHPRATWDMLQLGLRAGERPRVVVTTTPAAGAALGEIMKEDGTVTTGGATRRNIHLSERWKTRIHALYEGTRLEKQELEGELLPEANVALWRPELIERCRLQTPRHSSGGFTKVVIGVDPPSGDGTCGIIACAIDSAGIGYVLADHSVTQRRPEGWARAVADAALVHGRAGVPARIVAEKNQGGRMVESVLRAAGSGLKIDLVTASEGKAARAEPVATLFEGGKVWLAGSFPELEAELRGFSSGRGYEPGSWSAPGGGGSSPDRADAMVWALTALMLGDERAEARIRRL